MLTEREGRGVHDEVVLVLEERDHVREDERRSQRRVGELFERVAADIDVDVLKRRSPEFFAHGVVAHEAAQREDPESRKWGGERVEEHSDAVSSRRETRAH